MSNPIVIGFPRSTYVHIVRLVLAHKGVPYTFRDLEPEMGTTTHLALHPFGRVPVLQHDDFTLYETSAIAMYVDETYATPALQPTNPRERARMHQWISAVNSYYYPYMIYHVSHERNVFPELGIPTDAQSLKRVLDAQAAVKSYDRMEDWRQLDVQEERRHDYHAVRSHRCWSGSIGGFRWRHRRRSAEGLDHRHDRARNAKVDRGAG